MHKFKPEIVTTDLLKEIQQLDEVIFDFHQDLDWYTDRYLSKSVCITIRSVEGNLIGYLMAVGITSKLHKAFIKGTIQTDEIIDPKCYVPMEEADAIYLASIAIRESYRHLGFASMLNKILLAELEYMELNSKPKVALTLPTSFSLLYKEGFNKIFEGKYIVMEKV